MKRQRGFAPIYAAMYPALVAHFRSHGYALAIHGSVDRDFDLVAIPWTLDASIPSAVLADLEAIGNRRAVMVVPIPPTQKLHGRIAYTLLVSWAHSYIDLSFMPLLAALPTPPGDRGE